MKKILFVAAVISLLNACSESVYELPNGSAGGTSDGDVHEGAPCNVATDEAFCTSNGYAMQCINNEWDLLECNIGCKDGSCITEKTCNDGLIRSHCDNERIKVIECVSPSNTQNKWTINTIECSGHCIDTEKLNNTPVNAECVECTDIKDCCENELNGCVYSSCSNYKCITKANICDESTRQCTDDTNYKISCDGKIQPKSCKGDNPSKPYCINKECVECRDSEDCKKSGSEDAVCSKGTCIIPECEPGERFDPTQGCVKLPECDNSNQILDTISGECVDKCSFEGIKAYLEANKKEYEDNGIKIDEVKEENTCIFYPGSENKSVYSCDSFETTVDSKNIIFCGTVYLNDFDSLLNNIISSQVFSVQDAIITAHPKTTIATPLISSVSQSNIYKLQLQDIQFSDINPNEKTLHGIIDRIVDTKGERSSINNVTLNNISITTDPNSINPHGGFIGEAKYLSINNIKVNVLTVSASDNNGRVGGLIGTAEDVIISNPTISDLSIKASNGLDVKHNGMIGGIIGFGKDITINGGNIEGVSIDTDRDRVGGLIGSSEGKIRINKDTDDSLTITKTSIQGNNSIGGVIGYYEDESELSLHHINNSIQSITAKSNAAGFIGAISVDGLNIDAIIDIDDISNNCVNTGDCIKGDSNVAGFIGDFIVSEITSASVTNIYNDFNNSSISGRNSIAGFIANISINTEKNNIVTFNNIISNVKTILGSMEVGGFISNISFGENKTYTSQLRMSNIATKTNVYAASSIPQQLYNAEKRRLGTTTKYVNIQSNVYDRIDVSGFIYNTSKNWFTEIAATNNNYCDNPNELCCIVACEPMTSVCAGNRGVCWSDFSQSLYENAFVSRINVTNTVVKTNNHLGKNTRTGQNALSGIISKTEKRDCSRDNAKDLNNAMNKIYSSNVFVYSVIEPIEGEPNHFDIHTADALHYNSPIRYCYYDDFDTINIMYDTYCKDVNETASCDAVPEDAQIDNGRLVRTSDVPDRMDKGTWRYDKTLGLPVPALQGIVVKQEEPSPLEPIDSDDSREPAPDSPVEP